MPSLIYQQTYYMHFNRGDKMKPLERVMDALDVETVFICDNEQQGRNMMLGLLKSWGFTDVDVVFAQYIGPGVRIRGRAYAYRPADKYGWLLTEKEQGGSGR